MVSNKNLWNGFKPPTLYYTAFAFPPAAGMAAAAGLIRPAIQGTSSGALLNSLYRRPPCSRLGRCCRFDQASDPGHQLRGALVLLLEGRRELAPMVDLLRQQQAAGYTMRGVEAPPTAALLPPTLHQLQQSASHQVGGLPVSLPVPAGLMLEPAVPCKVIRGAQSEAPAPPSPHTGRGSRGPPTGCRSKLTRRCIVPYRYSPVVCAWMSMPFISTTLHHNVLHLPVVCAWMSMVQHLPEGSAAGRMKS